MKIARGVLGLTVMVLIIAMALCSKYDDKEYSISALDEACCQEFRNAVRYDTTWNADSTAFTKIDTVIISVDTVSSIPSQLYCWVRQDTVNGFPVDVYDTSAVSSNFQAMMDSLNMEKFQSSKITLDKPSIYLTTPSLYKSSYLNLICTGSSNYLLIFNDYININIYKSDGQIVKLSRNNIDMETFVGCRSIKTRLEYSLDAGRYMLEIVRDDKTLKSNMLLVIKQNQ
ncbi:MAG: hypothetical protein KBA26_07885 [Candidatus Delongbacteria bacterium]|nr:hypothetical protein [Candidatus Delongbacteria bacterium]